jgi:hypothetical protein
MEHDFILQRVVQERAIVVSVTITLIEYIGIQWLTPAQYYNKLLFVHCKYSNITKRQPLQIAFIAIIFKYRSRQTLRILNNLKKKTHFFENCHQKLTFSLNF